MTLISYQHGVYQNIFHVVLVTKYRYQMMQKEKYKLAVRQAIEEVAYNQGIRIIEMSVMNDHVHAVIDCHPTMSQALAIQLLKGASARALFQHYPNLRLRYPRGHFWSAGKCGRSVGDVDQETVIDYVRKQAGQATLADFH